MFYFRNPARGSCPRSRWSRAWPSAGLPPAHVGLARRPRDLPGGRLLRADGEPRARIAEYARPGEVLVSQEVVDASGGTEVAFRAIGPVELKGISGPVHLLAAHREG